MIGGCRSNIRAFIYIYRNIKSPSSVHLGFFYVNMTSCIFLIKIGKINQAVIFIY
jgi:hypothetical protein